MIRDTQAFYNQIQNLLATYSEPSEKLFFLFLNVSTEDLCNFVLHMDFGEKNEIIKEVVERVRARELKFIKLKPYDKEIEAYVKSMPTRQLLAKYNELRASKDEIFYCIRKELSNREHVPNKIEAKTIRREKSGRKVTKLEKKNAKVKEEVIRLKKKGYSVNECALKFKLTTEEVMYILKEAGHEDYFFKHVEEFETTERELIHYDLDFRPVYETWTKNEKRVVSKTHKAAKENAKNVYDEKFGFKK